jgi:hypothetical protein
VHTQAFGNATYEAGTDVYHSGDRYMNGFVDSLKLHGVAPDGDGGGTTGVWAGHARSGLRAETSAWSLVNLYKRLSRHGWDAQRLQGLVGEQVAAFDKIYAAQDKGESFATVRHMLKAMGPDVYNLTQTPGRWSIDRLCDSLCPSLLFRVAS